MDPMYAHYQRLKSAAATGHPVETPPAGSEPKLRRLALYRPMDGGQFEKVTFVFDERRNIVRETVSADDRATTELPAPGFGPGTELKKLLKRIGIVATANCRCNARAVEMDRKGVVWCRENIETIVGWLGEEARARRLPFSELAAKQIIKIAIRRAEKNK